MDVNDDALMMSGRERRLSGGKVGLMSQRVLRPGTDVEDALHDALVLL